MDDMSCKDILLVCDMDRTLLDSSSRLSGKNKDALVRFAKKGGCFTIATGRMQEAVTPYISELPISAPAILYNGAMIYDFAKNEVIWQKGLRNQLIDIIEDVYSRFDDIGIEVFGSGRIHIIRGNVETEKHVLREKLTPIMCKLQEIPFPWIKVILACEHKRLKEVESYLNDKKTHFRTVFSEPQFLEIIEESVSKGAALKQLADILGYPCSRVVSVGDNMNDVELIQDAGVGIAVGNAHPYLKEVADMCCCHHDEDAIAEVIAWIEEGKLIRKSGGKREDGLE